MSFPMGFSVRLHKQSYVSKIRWIWSDIEVMLVNNSISNVYCLAQYCFRRWFKLYANVSPCQIALRFFIMPKYFNTLSVWFGSVKMCTILTYTCKLVDFFVTKFSRYFLIRPTGVVLPDNRCGLILLSTQIVITWWALD